MIKIRMARGGRINKPIFTIVATDSRMPRDGRFIEKLGQYDPQATPSLKDVNTASITEWVKNGAHLSDTVKSLLKKNNIALN